VAIPLSVWEDTWAEPSERFEGWVRECAMYSLREYCRPERSNRISPEEAVWTYRKALRTVVDNERKARSPRMRLQRRHVFSLSSASCNASAPTAARSCCMHGTGGHKAPAEVPQAP